MDRDKKINIKVLERGDDRQCASVEEMDVLQSHSVLEVYHTAICVGGLGDINLEQLVPLVIT